MCQGTCGDAKVFAGKKAKRIGKRGRVSRRDGGSTRRGLLGGGGKIKCDQPNEAVDGMR